MWVAPRICAATFFSVVGNFITVQARGYMLGEFLSADDLVRMSETIEGLCNKFIKWKEVFENKVSKLTL